MRQSSRKRFRGACMYTNGHVKQFQLVKQQLAVTEAKAFSQPALFTLLRKIGYIQLDSINVTNARSQDIFLWSRFKDYQNTGYVDAYTEGDAVEVYLNALSLMLKDSQLVQNLRRMNLATLQNDVNYPDYIKIYRQLIQVGRVYKKDFVTNHNLPQWEMSKEDNAIDKLWRAGLIDIQRDRSFRKILIAAKDDFDDSPADVNELEKQVYADLILLTFNNLGIATKKDVFNGAHFRKRLFDSVFDELLKEKQITNITVEGQDHYILASDLDAFHHNDILPNMGTLLTPFDNLIRDRARTLRLFGINYKLESYTPTADRKLGYFALPILIHSDIVGTVDLRFDRARKQLGVNRLVWKNEMMNHHENKAILDDILQRFTDFIRR
ncbi:winged helix DNA-binding domain-containing protein [Lacticaseibacillus casei]|uniref:DNA glycosylase AlkZ-like family protein n=1 Tax=Lacticaseibacillus casei TaxID=1582 RepID=UPI00237D5A0C|nr:crosslink repair DNA glycosylase YcaQ family protein [Lacticaseibacillus casei]MDE3283764.1 winged helix DNA-binding domain-containing protein [Lacticaseibacillus casei]